MLMSLSKKKYVTVFVGILFTLCLNASNMPNQPISGSFVGPKLFFEKNELALLRERIEQPEFAFLWQENLELAQAYIDPASEHYVDPESFIEEWRHTAWYARPVHARIEVLGFATLMTGDRRYADHAIAIMVEAARLEHPEREQASPHRAYAMVLDWCRPYMSDDQKAIIVGAATDFVRHKTQVAFSENTWWFPYHNWMGVDMGAAGLIALALREEFPDEYKIWMRRVNEGIETWLRSSFDHRGGQVEGTQYYQFAFSNVLRYLIALKRLEGLDLLSASKAAHLPNFLAMSLLPGEDVFDARGSANFGGMKFVESTMFALLTECPLMLWLREQAADKFERDYRYPNTRGFVPQRLLWQSHDVTPKSPEEMGIPKAQLFDQRGLAIWRTGWTKNDIMFSVESGPFHRVTHNVADKGHFTLYGLGYRWATDPGMRRPLTEFHNCILINGKGQMPSGSGLGTNGRLIRWHDQADFGYALLDSTEAYNQNIADQRHEQSQWWLDRGTPREAQKRQLVRHVYRHTLFIKPNGERPAYVIIFDDVNAVEERSDFTWQMVTWPNLSYSMQEGHVVINPVDAKADCPRMEIYLTAYNLPIIEFDTLEINDNRRPGPCRDQGRIARRPESMARNNVRSLSLSRLPRQEESQTLKWAI
jgi:hypothetical protein